MKTVRLKDDDIMEMGDAFHNSRGRKVYDINDSNKAWAGQPVKAWKGVIARVLGEDEAEFLYVTREIKGVELENTKEWDI